MWSDLDRECLLARSCLTFRSLHDPEALEQQILGLLSKFQELVETDQFASFRARDAASRIIVIIQNVFRVRNLDTSEAVAQLVKDLQSFNKLEQFSSLSANNIDLFDCQNIDR